MSTRASHARRQDAPSSQKGRMRVSALLALALIVALYVAAFSAAAQIPPAANQYRQTIARETAFRFGAAGPVPVIAAQIMQESQFNPAAHSQVGAQGLMQFMPTTAAWAGQAGVDGPVQPLSAQWSIRAGVWYDRWLFDRVKGNTECDRLAFALQAYNSGLGWVYKRQKLSLQPGTYAVTGLINPGVHPASQREAQGYAPVIMGRWQPLFTSWGRPVPFPCSGVIQ